jgi:large-conductance mechanosensitive channel
MPQSTLKEDQSIKHLVPKAVIYQHTDKKGKTHTTRVPINLGPDVVVGGFITFLREHAIIGLAVGFVIGSQVQTVVKQMVASFISPAFMLIFGTNLDKATFTWHFRGRAQAFGWGGFVYGVLNFVFVLFAIYFIIRILKLEKLDRPAIKK